MNKNHTFYACILSLLPVGLILPIKLAGGNVPMYVAPLLLVNLLMVIYHLSIDTKYDMRKLAKKHLGSGQ
jgi:hypothetical protein